MDLHQQPDRDPVEDLLLGQPTGQKLRPGHDPVLPGRDFRDDLLRFPE